MEVFDISDELKNSSIIKKIDKLHKYMNYFIVNIC